MKKRILLALCVWIIALVAVASVACAEGDPVHCAIELSPEYLAGPGEVKVTITISNTTNEDLQEPVILFSPQAEIVADFGNAGSVLLKAGESQTWTGTYSINERELQQGFIQFFAKYTIYKDNGQATPRSQAIRATVSRQEAEAAIDVERTITPAAAHEGQEVQVKYTILNAGTIALQDVTIVEHANINNKAQTIPQLDPGAKVDLTYKVTMGKEDLTSAAQITYKAMGSTKTETHTVDEKKIPFAQTNLTAELTSNVKGVVSGGTLTLTLELKNKGSSDMSDIRVTDAVLGDVFTNQTVEAGKTLTLEKEITLTESGEYQFIINAIDSTGTEVTATSNVLAVTAMNPEDALNLTLTAVPDRTTVYDDPAGVRFTVTITNDSKVDATDVTISHGYIDIYTFETIKAGESRTLSRDTVLSTSGKFQFTATAKDPLENESSFHSNEMQIAVYAPTPVPATPTPPPVPTAEPTFVPATWAPIHHESIGTIPKLIQKILLPALIVAGILLLGSGGLLAVAGKKRLDNKKASEAAYDHLERARRRDYTVTNPDEMAAASKATLSQNSAKADENGDLLVQTDDDWDLPPVESLTLPPEQDELQQESYSSFGQGFYNDMGDDGFETDATQMNAEYEAADYTQNAAAENNWSYDENGYEAQPVDAAGYENYDAQSYDAQSYDAQGYEQQPYDAQGYEPVGGYQNDAYQLYDYTTGEGYSFDQPETVGDDRMAYSYEYNAETQYDGYEPYNDMYDGYEPLPQQPADTNGEAPQQESEQPRGRRNRN